LATYFADVYLKLQEKFNFAPIFSFKIQFYLFPKIVLSQETLTIQEQCVIIRLLDATIKESRECILSDFTNAIVVNNLNSFYTGPHFLIFNKKATSFRET